MTSEDESSVAAQWVADQLSRPLDISEEHTVIYEPEALAKEVGRLAEGIEEYATLDRVLARREKRIKKKILELQLVEVSRLRGVSEEKLIREETVLPEIEDNLRDLWEQILDALDALEPPVTRRLLSEEAILVYADSKKLVVHANKSRGWICTFQRHRLHLLERAVAVARGAHLDIQFELKEFPVIDTVAEAKSGTWTSHGVIISLYDTSEDKDKTLSDISVQREDDIELLIKAWTHHGGRLEDLSGIPAYLKEQ